MLYIYMSFQIISPIVMPISASTYVGAVKKFVKFNRDMNLQQLIIQDQLNNNRMLGNINYYTNGNRHKARIIMEPTTLFNISDIPTGYIVGRNNMILPFPSPLITNIKGTMIPQSTIFGSGSNLPKGTVLPSGTFIDIGNYIDPLCEFPRGTVIAPGTFFPPATVINRTAIIPPGFIPNVHPSPQGAFFPIGTTIGPNSSFPPGFTFLNSTILPTTNLPFETIIPLNTCITPTTRLPTGFTFEYGSTIIGGSVFHGNTTFPLGTNILNTCVFPPKTNLPQGTILPRGVMIDLTGVPDIIIPLAGFLPGTPMIGTIFPLNTILSGGNLPGGTVLPSGFKFVQGSELVNGTIFDGITPDGSGRLNYLADRTEILSTVTNNVNRNILLPLAMPTPVSLNGMYERGRRMSRSRSRSRSRSGSRSRSRSR